MSRDLLLLAGLLLVAPVAHGRGDPPNAGTVYEPAGRPVEPTASDLLRLPRADLEALYRAAEAGPMPEGEAEGHATLHPGTPHGDLDQRVIGDFWKGKVFTRVDDERAELVNRILDGTFVKAEVFYGPSRLDGKRSIVVDYHRTSVVAVLIRDELRRVAPGVYLGLAYFRGLPVPPAVFVLEFPKGAPTP